MIERPVVVLGSGGHAGVVVDTLRALGAEIRGIVTRDESHQGGEIHGVPVLGDDDFLADRQAEVVLVSGIGGVGDNGARAAVFARFRAAGFLFPPLVHPRAVVSETARLGVGAQIMAGAVVQPGAHIGENVLVNTSASIDHDCTNGAHAHISPGAVLCGDVQVGARAHVGARAVVLQGVTIGSATVVGAGAVVVADLPDGVTAVGVPAKIR